MTDRDRLAVKICNATQKTNFACKEAKCVGKGLCVHCYVMADELLANGVIVPPCKVGEEIWVIDREDGEAVDISCVMFLAKSKGCIIATSWINDYDLDETLEYHINETQENFDTDLNVYPDEDCFLTKEEAEEKLKEFSNG